MVFSSLADLAARIDDPALEVEREDVLVLQNAGPHAPECMPEAGYLPIPKKLAQRGVKDMIRVSDARMSGTAFGTIVLHVTPDAASGGPLGAGAQRRPHPAVGRAAAHRCSWSRRPSWSGARGWRALRGEARRAAMPGSTRRKSSAPTRLRLRLPAAGRGLGRDQSSCGGTEHDQGEPAPACTRRYPVAVQESRRSPAQVTRRRGRASTWCCAAIRGRAEIGCA